MPKNSPRPSRQIYKRYNGVLGEVVGVSDTKEKNGALQYMVKCSSCGEIHYRSAKHLKQNIKSQDCKNYKPPNWTGFERADAIIRRQYGISMQEFTELLEFQKGGCAICNKPIDALRRRMNIDHCHETNEVRGILCSGCNTGLGHLGDNVEGLKKAIDYLLNPTFQQYTLTKVI